MPAGIDLLFIVHSVVPRLTSVPIAELEAASSTSLIVRHSIVFAKTATSLLKPWIIASWTLLTDRWTTVA